ncbi:MAG: hypothetical protein ACE5KP_05210 [Dehalococcoidales bacterium]
MNKKWMPITAGILNIISGIVQLLVAIGAFRWLYSGEGFTKYEYSPEYTPEGYLLRFFLPFFISGIVAIGGGISAVKRDKMLGLVWAGAIAASFPLLISWSFLSDMFALVFDDKVYTLTGLFGIFSLILIDQYQTGFMVRAWRRITSSNWLGVFKRAFWSYIPVVRLMIKPRSIAFITIGLVLLFRLTIWSFPIPPFCSAHYTSTYFHLNNIPEPDEFANFLEQDGWRILSRDWFSGGDGRGRVLAEKETWVFFSKPRIQVRLFSKYYISEEGSIKVTIAEGTGNKIANRIVFNDFVKETNDNFNLNLSYDRYNYIRNCD